VCVLSYLVTDVRTVLWLLASGNDTPSGAELLLTYLVADPGLLCSGGAVWRYAC
jgi:hypothetical protein